MMNTFKVSLQRTLLITTVFTFPLIAGCGEQTSAVQKKNYVCTQSLDGSDIGQVSLSIDDKVATISSFTMYYCDSIGNIRNYYLQSLPPKPLAEQGPDYARNLFQRPDCGSVHLAMEEDYRYNTQNLAFDQILKAGFLTYMYPSLGSVTVFQLSCVENS